MQNAASRLHPTTKWDVDIVPTGGANVFVPLPEHQADEVTIIIPSGGVGIDIKQSNNPDDTKFVSIDAPSGLTIALSGGTGEVAVRRTDGSASSVNVRFIWRKVGR